ncbi:MAG: NPCBM/NEW2 domain-containing protein [Planctomycetes bacterium]|nr:NPCBM/NEW2 domain-containing protein [Planctomycetota bacterium]
MPRHSGSLAKPVAAPWCHSVIAVVALLSAIVRSMPGQAPVESTATAAAALALSLSDGRTLVASRLEGTRENGFAATVDGRVERLSRGDLVAVHGVAVQPLDLAAAWLPAGEVVRGTLTGGDPAGDTLTILSPVLGSVELAVDRLAAFVPAGGASPRLEPAALPLPTGVDEALFVHARIGYDLLAGSLHRFTPQGVRFATSGNETAKAYGKNEFVALRIGDPAPREEPPVATLLTRTGDRLGVGAVVFTAEGVRCELENGAVAALRVGDLACLSFRGPWTYLSDLEPTAVDETGFEGPVLLPYRRDAAVAGGALVAADRTHGKGLGVHSRSRLTFTVPPGAASFWTRVALDDSAAALPLRPDVDVRVVHGGVVAFERRGLEPGGEPADTGLLPVSPGATLILEVDFGKGRELGDRVDWLTPIFLPSPAR